MGKKCNYFKYEGKVVKEQNSAVIIYAIHVWLTSHFRNNVCTLFLKTYQGK